MEKLATKQEEQGILQDCSRYVEDFYNRSSDYGYGIEPDEIYECYLEECDEDEVEPSFGIEDIEEALEQIKWEEQNTCDRCGGRGCNYCLMLSY